jgi:hypothetical protein
MACCADTPVAEEIDQTGDGRQRCPYQAGEESDRESDQNGVQRVAHQVRAADRIASLHRRHDRLG